MAIARGMAAPEPSPPPDLPAISVKHVSKTFRLYDNPVTGPLKALLRLGRANAGASQFEAVRDVSLEVAKGEVVGIVGPNGAGKTTLLKMIAGLLPVDRGSIEVRGQVTALLALGVGVHPEFTGRENILYGGLLLGMSRSEVARKTDAIIAFSELGAYIDRPFRTYSSGMKARLLFSISMSIDPDILIVDEALATGDAYFVQKCAQRIRELCRSGATILFVSHNLSQIGEICSRAILMAEGRILESGSPPSIVAAYNRYAFHRQGALAGPVPTGYPPLTSGTGTVRARSICLLGPDGQTATALYTGEPATLSINYESELDESESVTLFAGFMRASDGLWVGEVFSRSMLLDASDAPAQQTLSLRKGAGTIRVELSPLLLLNDHYQVWLMIYSARETLCEYKGVAPFFAARRVHVLDRGPLYMQPAKIIID